MARRSMIAALILVGLGGLACTNSVAIPQATTRDGGELFTQEGCSGCHIDGGGRIAPSLVGVFGEMVRLENGDTVIADSEYIRESILSPHAKIVAGYDPIMPAYSGKLTEEQLVSLVEHIRSLAD